MTRARHYSEKKKNQNSAGFHKLKVMVISKKPGKDPQNITTVNFSQTWRKGV